MVLEHLEAVFCSKRLVYGPKTPKPTLSLKGVISEKSLKMTISVSNRGVITPKPPKIGSAMNVRIQENF